MRHRQPDCIDFRPHGTHERCISAKRTPSVKRLYIVIPRQVLRFHAKILGFHANAKGRADEIAEAEDMALMLFRGGLGTQQSFSQRTQKLKTAFAACKFELRV
jgi:hypothetical protein